MDQLKSAFERYDAVDLSRFARRHEPLLQPDPITRTEAPVLGYLSGEELQRLGIGPTSAEKDAIRKKGLHNHKVYLTYDHLDVYVATSMRKPFDYWNVHTFVSRLFSSPLLKELKLRWFDPTQAYCQNRRDKRLVEGLMLKRAKCTIYLAQESETLGKDSELATTLVQGKPVIAYVPHLTNFDQFYSDIAELRDELYGGSDPNVLIMELLRLYYPEGEWSDETVRSWLERPDSTRFQAGCQVNLQQSKGDV